MIHHYRRNSKLLDVKDFMSKNSSKLTSLIIGSFLPPTLWSQKLQIANQQMHLASMNMQMKLGGRLGRQPSIHWAYSFTQFDYQCQWHWGSSNAEISIIRTINILILMQLLINMIDVMPYMTMMTDISALDNCPWHWCSDLVIE